MLEAEGTTVLVTGATSGIGLATAATLVQKGARSLSRAATPIDARPRRPSVSAAGWIAADFADLRQVAALADEFRDRYGRLDVLINNAGAVFQRRQLTADGLEMTFAVNHLAPFLLTTRLLDTLVASAPARVVNVTSVAHAMGHLDFDDLQLAGRYRPFQAYAGTKLANMMFSNELARRLAGTGVTANAVHPGLVRTHIGAKGGSLTRVVWSLTQLRYRNAVVEPEQAARPSCDSRARPRSKASRGRTSTARPRPSRRPSRAIRLHASGCGR